MPTLVYRQSSDEGNPLDSVGGQQGSTTPPTMVETSTHTKSSKATTSANASPPDATESPQASGEGSSDTQTSSQSSSSTIVTSASPTSLSTDTTSLSQSFFPTTAVIDPTSSTAPAKPIATNLVVPKNHRAAIAGGVVGGLIAFAILVFTLYMVERKRRNRRNAETISVTADEKPKIYWNLDMQEQPRSPEEFFPREYRGTWPPEVKFQSTPHMI